MMKKHIIVVGAGIAGLTAGIYALQSGFDVTILEQHAIAGGFCTSWKRKGYTFEGAVHWLTGSNKDTPLYTVWEETGALSGDVKLYRHEPFTVYEYNGKQICLYRDIDKLKAHLMEISPEDTDAIKKLCRDIKLFTALMMPVIDEKGVKVKIKRRMKFSQFLAMLPALLSIKRFTNVSTGKYVSAFKHEGIRALFTKCVIPEEFCSMSLLITLATFAADGAFPEGGSLGMIKRMTDKFVSLGGNLRLNTEVEKVLVENGQAIGVLAQGEKNKADAVIVTQDIMTAVDKLFFEPPEDAWIAKMKQNTKPQLCTFVSLGVHADLSDLPHSFVFPLDKPISCGGKDFDVLGFTNYALHKDYSPPGCTALTTIFIGDTYDYWEKAKAEGRYELEKEAVAKQVTEALIKKLPRLENAIEVTDVATPLTYERYTGSFKGSWMTILYTGEEMTQYPCTCEGISGLFFAGQRVLPPGGLPAALYTGRKAAQLLCREFDAVFQCNL